MIISASRRSDIPAFYSGWFLKRLEEGFVYVRNPINRHQVSKVKLGKDVVDAFVFWTKDPRGMMDKLEQLEGYEYYFQFTLTPYDRSIEGNLPDKNQIIETFVALSRRIGPSRVIWRYDPIFLTDKFNEEYHIRAFTHLAEKLNGCTEKCIISFLDLYKKCERNMRTIKLIPMDAVDKRKLALGLAHVAEALGIKLESCAENMDLPGIDHGKCIDAELISRLSGVKLDIPKDKNQRPRCGCAQSIDIGAYNTCLHSCIYCYANSSKEAVERNTKLSKIDSPILCDTLEAEDRIIEREMGSCARRRASLLDLL